MNYNNYFTNTVKQNHQDIQAYLDFQSKYSFYFHFDKKELWKYGGGGVTLDFGGRIGEKTSFIKNRVVVEIDKSSLTYMKKHNIPNSNKLNYKNVSLIYCDNVLEHIPNWQSYLQKFHKVLNKKGMLILVLPAETQEFESNYFVDWNGHTNVFNFSTVFFSLEEAGFEIQSYKLVAIPTYLIKLIGFEMSYKLNQYRLFRYLLFIKILGTQLVKSIFHYLSNYLKFDKKFLKSAGGSIVIIASKRKV